VATNIRPVIRKATKDDLEKQSFDLEKAREFFDLCAKKVIEKDLPMKLVDVFLEEARVIFFFFAEERVDFRGLVKDLAGHLHRRIEMRQIGARDAAKAIGALGPCGLTCCCETYLNEFMPISIAMAKNQGLSPNPAKLTGMCGKLKCCLSYENEAYLEERKELPPGGSKVKTPEGPGVVIDHDVLKHVCLVRMDGEDRMDQRKFKCEDCVVLSRPRSAEKDRKKDKEEETKDEDKEIRKLEG
jgi:cell fate regulator YaaT (PSP1 superfamily)